MCYWIDLMWVKILLNHQGDIPFQEFILMILNSWDIIGWKWFISSFAILVYIVY